MVNNELLKDFVFVSKYARVNDGKKETFEQAVDRILGMHQEFLTIRYGVDEQRLKGYLEEIRKPYIEQKILGAQRALQWGGIQLMYKHPRMYNCSSSYVDRVEYFSQLMFLLLAGAGVGYSCQKEHVSKLPVVQGPTSESKVFVIPDSIEGWADSVKALFESYFYHLPKVKFDGSAVRPKGSYISGGFKAPGPEPLLNALRLCEDILKRSIGRQLTPVEASDLSCIIADAVISGGVRRAALLALFSIDDEEFLDYKTGDWWIKHPYRARANVSATVLPTTTYQQYERVFASTRQFGEPGIAFLESVYHAYNPLEIAA